MKVKIFAIFVCIFLIALSFLTVVKADNTIYEKNIVRQNFKIKNKYEGKESISISVIKSLEFIVIFFSKIVEDFDIPESDFQYDIHPGKLFTGIFRIEVEDKDGTQFYYKSGLYFLGMHISAGDVYSSGHISEGGVTFKITGIGFGKIDFAFIY